MTIEKLPRGLWWTSSKSLVPPTDLLSEDKDLGFEGAYGGWKVWEHREPTLVCVIMPASPQTLSNFVNNNIKFWPHFP